MIDAKRHYSHKIYDVYQAIPDASFTRNCKFKYYTDKNGTKKYKPKMAEIKVERYKKAKGDTGGERIGYKKIDICQFLNKGFVTRTFKMSKDESIYFTVKILCISTDHDGGGGIDDIARNAGGVAGPRRAANIEFDEDEYDDESSSEEAELKGE